MRDTLYTFLLKVKNSPSLYLGKPSLTALTHFIHVYSFKAHEIGEICESSIDFENFQVYVEKLYGLEPIYGDSIRPTAKSFLH
jgi:hypothetical protein